MIIGQATLGTEISEQNKEFDVVILPTTIDGCGLTADIAMAIRRWNSDIKIIVSEYIRTQMFFCNLKSFLSIISI